MRLASFDELPRELKQQYRKDEVRKVEILGSQGSVIMVELGEFTDRWELSGPTPDPSTWTWKQERQKRVTESLYERAVAVAEQLKPEIVRRAQEDNRRFKERYPTTIFDFLGEVRYPGADYPDYIGQFSMWQLLYQEECGPVLCGVLSHLPMEEMYPLFRKAFGPLGVPIDHPWIKLESQVWRNVLDRSPVVATLVVEKGKPVYLRPAVGGTEVFEGVKIELCDNGLLKLQSDPFYLPASRADEKSLPSQAAGLRLYAWLGYAPGVALTNRGLPFAEVVEWQPESDHLVLGLYAVVEQFVPAPSTAQPVAG